ncbi:MAG: hypothetical protein KAT43_02200 [Nanoarchaeota archaeon]|nr:hypothetical protein [Nanoarchaeota archaeon]
MTERPCSEPCEGASHFHPGLNGNVNGEEKIMIILHKPDSRVAVPGLFPNQLYEIALFQTRTGKKILEMLNYCGLSRVRDNIFITNLFKCVLLEDKNPKKKEYEKCRPILEEQVREFQPRRIIACGSTVYNHLFPEEERTFEERLGKIQEFNGVLTFVLNHPSRKWMYSPEKKEADYAAVKKFIEPLKITLCSSAKFFPRLPRIKKALQKLEYEILLPSMIDFHDPEEEEFIRRQTISTIDHFRKIGRSDAIYVANYDNERIPGRVGENSFSEIAVAFYKKIPIFLMNPVPEMSYRDVIQSMQPHVVGRKWKILDQIFRSVVTQ